MYFYTAVTVLIIVLLHSITNDTVITPASDTETETETERQEGEQAGRQAPGVYRTSFLLVILLSQITITLIIKYKSSVHSILKIG